MISQVDSDPWMEAWRKLEAFIITGATKQQSAEYARELGRSLPDARALGRLRATSRSSATGRTGILS